MKCILVLLLIFLLPHNIVQGKTWRIKERRKTVTLDEADRDCDANVGRLAVIRTAVDKDDVIDRLSEDGKHGAIIDSRLDCLNECLKGLPLERYGSDESDFDSELD